MPITPNTEINAWTRRYIKAQIEALDDDVTANAVKAANPTTLTIPTGTPVNAVAASKVLTVSNTPSEGDTVSMGGVTYKARLDALGLGVAANKSFLFAVQPGEGETITIGTKVYRFRVSALAGDQAENDVYRGGGTSACIDNLITAITTGYVDGVVGTGTTPHPLVGATKTDTQNIKITATTIGFAGNAIALAETFDNASCVWFGNATFLTGGIDPQAVNDVYCTTAESFIDNLVLAVTAGTGAGTNYGTGTVANPLVIAVKASASTMTCTNKVMGLIGNDTVIAKSGANLAWASTATKLSGGVNGTVGIANQILADRGYIYICTETNTISDANWKKSQIA